jgi:hypothetical protein
MTACGRYIAVLLFVPGVFGQHSRGVAPGNSGGRVGATRSTFVRTNRFRGQIRNGFIAPYAPLFDYGYLGYDPYLANYGDEFSSPPAIFYVLPPVGPTSPEPAEPVRPAQAVIHEYKVDHEAAEGEKDITFTIALKDGSKRFAAASWVQNGKLHYVNSEGRQEILSPDSIDREATNRLNQQNHLRMQLPPS